MLRYGGSRVVTGLRISLAGQKLTRPVVQTACRCRHLYAGSTLQPSGHGPSLNSPNLTTQLHTLAGLTSRLEGLSLVPTLQERLSQSPPETSISPLLQHQQVRGYQRRKKIDSIKLIRRRKMKKHKLKKLRKRMLFLNRHILHRRRKRKEKAFKEMLARYRQYGLDFDAERYVEEQLSLAKKGGYKVDIFESFKKQKAGMQ